MSEPDRQHPAGPVTPHTRRFQLRFGPNRLHSLFGGISNGDNSPCGRSNRLSPKGQYRSSIAIAFPVPNNDVLDWRSVFFVGLLTLHFGIGVLILLWWVVWTVIRCVKGLLTLNMGEPIRNPNSSLFGEP